MMLWFKVIVLFWLKYDNCFVFVEHHRLASKELWDLESLV